MNEHDIKIAAAMRVGTGFDVHRLVDGRPLMLGGVRIPFAQGLIGHSDADVLVHAACDALLGAAGLGDIGMLFPDSDPAFKDIDSLQLLRETCRRVRACGFEIGNLDATVFAQRPKLAPYRQAMCERLAAAMDVALDRVNIKATTTEGLGPFGRGEGIGAASVALIVRPPEASRHKSIE